MGRLSAVAWNRRQEETAEKHATGRWPVYEADLYELDGVEGARYIRVRKPAGTASLMGAEVASVNLFSPEYRGLFLEFARWFDSQKMESGFEKDLGRSPTLATLRNAEAALKWARKYGVLGLGRNPNSTVTLGSDLGPSSIEIAARLLGRPHLGHNGARAYRMSAEGGKHEKVEIFVLKALEANVVLKLYAAATADPPNVVGVQRFLPDERIRYAYPPGASPSYAKYTERETWAGDSETARTWALTVAENAVARNVESDVYPILLGERGSYEEGWGFKSLLGAMWLQMRTFMLGDKIYEACAYCNELFYKRRRDKIYCGESCGNRARAARSYERKKQRQQEARAATKRRLRG